MPDACLEGSAMEGAGVAHAVVLSNAGVGMNIAGQQPKVASHLPQVVSQQSLSTPRHSHKANTHHFRR